MEDKFEHFFSENNFDFQEPHSGHLERFERKLNQPKKVNRTSWKWLSLAASVVLVLGFWLGNNHQNNKIDIAKANPSVEEIQNYFIATINDELKTIESNRSLETETIIEEALNDLEDLEESYIILTTKLSLATNRKKIIKAMIKNYEERLKILDNLLLEIDQIKNPKIIEDEIYI